MSCQLHTPAALPPTHPRKKCLLSPLQRKLGGLSGKGKNLSGARNLIFCLSCPRRVQCIYQITIWTRVHLKKLTVPQPVKKLPAFCGTRRFITPSARRRKLLLPGPQSLERNLAPEDAGLLGRHGW